MRCESVLEAIGHTPLLRLSVEAPPGVAVYAKLELQNLFAMKDRAAKQMVLDARASGELAEGAPIIESSSGTMALGLALVGTALGHPVHIVTDPRIDPITLAKLETLGCQVHVVTSMTGAGWQSARLERLARLMSDLDVAFWPRPRGARALARSQGGRRRLRRERAVRAAGPAAAAAERPRQQSPAGEHRLCAAGRGALAVG